MQKNTLNLESMRKMLKLHLAAYPNTVIDNDLIVGYFIHFENEEVEQVHAAFLAAERKNASGFPCPPGKILVELDAMKAKTKPSRPEYKLIESKEIDYCDQETAKEWCKLAYKKISEKKPCTENKKRGRI